MSIVAALQYVARLIAIAASRGQAYFGVAAERQALLIAFGL